MLYILRLIAKLVFFDEIAYNYGYKKSDNRKTIVALSG